jgi:hypothetical protein
MKQDSHIRDLQSSVSEHIAALEDGWTDWLSLIRVTDVVEGILVFDHPEHVRTAPDKYLTARIESCRYLLGTPAVDPRQLTIFNNVQPRWSYRPMYSPEIEHVSGQLCIVFLHGRHVQDVSDGVVLPIIRCDELGIRREQLRHYLALASLDPIATSRLVAKPDPRVKRIIARLGYSVGSQALVQSCFDDLRRVGAAALPGILDAMLDLLLNPQRDLDLSVDGIFHRDGGDSQEPSIVCETAFDCLALSAVYDVPYGFPPGTNFVDRWRLVQMIALTLLKREDYQEDHSGSG